MTWIDPRIWLVIVGSIGAGVMAGYVRGHADGVQAATAVAQKAQIAAVTAARAEEQRRTAAQQELAEHAAKDRDRAREDAVAAASAADGLRKQVAVLVSSARHSAAATGGPAADDAIGMLADVLGRADARAGVLADYADRARIAGEQCERDYDSLTTKEVNHARTGIDQ